MGDFNKKEYDKVYQRNNVKQIKLSVRNEEYDAFNAYCTKINVNRSAYLKKLINTDATNNGFEPIFSIKDTE